MHVSGHGAEEELKLVLALVRPRYFIPIHGEYRQLARHARIAELVTGGLPTPVDVITAEDGDVIRFDGDGGRVADKAPTGRVLIDGTRVGEVGDEVLRDRRHLAADGLVVPVVAINRQTGAVDSMPEIIARGFVTDRESDDVLARRRAAHCHGDRRVQRRREDRLGFDPGKNPSRTSAVPAEADGPAADGAAGRDGDLTPQISFVESMRRTRRARSNGIGADGMLNPVS